MKSVLVIFCVALLACGKVVPIEEVGDGGGNTNADAGSNADASVEDLCGGPEIALEDLETCFAFYQCQYMVRCFPGFPDQNFCEDRIMDFFALHDYGSGASGDNGPSRLFFETMKRAVDSGVSTYHGDRVLECLQGMSDASCQQQDGSSAACDTILTGDLSAGSECYDDLECAEGTFCSRDDGTSCQNTGRCESTVGLDANCESERCAPGLHCVNNNTGTRICANGQNGSPCDGSWDCNQELYCNSNNKCVNDLPSGSACEVNEQCPGDEICVDSTCSRVSAVNDRCQGHCWGNLYCNSSNTCQPLPGVGGLCSSGSQGSSCDSIDLICSPADTCVFRVPEGGVCSVGGAATNVCQLGLFCKQSTGPGTCTAPQANTSPCTAGNNCQSGYCDFTSPQQCSDYTACWEAP